MNPKARSRYRLLLRACFLALPVSLVFPLAQNASAADGTWNADAGGNWTVDTGTNWAGGTVAQGTDSTGIFNTVNITSNRTVTLTASLTIGNLTFGDATTSSNSWTLAQTGSSVLTLQTTTGTPTITVDNQTATISAGLGGNQGFTKAGAGKLVLSGGHALTGGFTVNAGTLDLWDTTSAYSNDINLASSGSILDAANTGSSTVTITGNITGSGKISKTSGSSTLILTGNNDFTGGVTLGAGGMVVGSGTNNSIGTGTLTLNTGSFRASDNNSRTFANTIAMGSGALRFGGLQGDTTGLGNLTFTSTVSTSIGGAKTWTINNATVVSFANNWSGNSGWTVTKAGTGTLVFNGNLTSNGVGLIVSAGQMVLNGVTNSYTGATTVNGGTLMVNGGITASAVTVNTGGRIGGTGSVGAVTFSSGAAIAYEVATAAQGGDGLTTTGFTGTGVGSFTIYLSGAATGFNATSDYTWAVLSSNTTDIASIVLSNITLDTSAFGQAYTGTFNLSKDAGSIYVNYVASAIPEPSTYAMIAGGALLGFAAMRRRRVTSV